MLQMYPENTVDVTYRQNKILKDLISLSLFPPTVKKTTTALLKNVTEDAIFVKNLL